MTQKDVAARMERHKSFVGHLERDRAKRPSYALLVELAGALGEPVDTLLEATGLRERYQEEARRPDPSEGQEKVMQYVRTRLTGLTPKGADHAIVLLETIAEEAAPGHIAE